MGTTIDNNPPNKWNERANNAVPIPPQGPCHRTSSNSQPPVDLPLQGGSDRRSEATACVSAGAPSPNPKQPAAPRGGVTTKCCRSAGTSLIVIVTRSLYSAVSKYSALLCVAEERRSRMVGVLRMTGVSHAWCVVTRRHVRSFARIPCTKFVARPYKWRHA